MYIRLVSYLAQVVAVAVGRSRCHISVKCDVVVFCTKIEIIALSVIDFCLQVGVISRRIEAVTMTTHSLTFMWRVLCMIILHVEALLGFGFGVRREALSCRLM